MNMDIEKHIEELLVSTKFESLTPAQKEMVLSVMTESEYVQQYALISKSKKMFQDEGALLSPDPDLLFSLREAHAAKKNSKGAMALLSVVAGIRIPAYQVGIAAVLLFLFFFWWPSTTLRNGAIEPQVVYETIIDTVEIIKEIPMNVEVPVERVVREVVFVDRPILDVELRLDLESTGGITPPATAPDLATMERSFGNSGISSEDLDQFRVEI